MKQIKFKDLKVDQVFWFEDSANMPAKDKRIKVGRCEYGIPRLDFRYEIGENETVYIKEVKE